jgi:hypothetical protein
MEAVSSSEKKTVNYQTTRRHSLEDNILYSPRRDVPKCNMTLTALKVLSDDGTERKQDVGHVIRRIEPWTTLI